MIGEFLKIKCIGGFHIIRINEIVTISPKLDGEKNKSEIMIKKGQEFLLFYSTEKEQDIFNKILEK